LFSFFSPHLLLGGHHFGVFLLVLFSFHRNLLGHLGAENRKPKTIVSVHPVGKSGGKILWENPVGKSGGKIRWENPVGKSGGKIRWENPVGKSGGKILCCVALPLSFLSPTAATTLLVLWPTPGTRMERKWRESTQRGMERNGERMEREWKESTEREWKESTQREWKETPGKISRPHKSNTSASSAYRLCQLRPFCCQLSHLTCFQPSHVFLQTIPLCLHRPRPLSLPLPVDRYLRRRRFRFPHALFFLCLGSRKKKVKGHGYMT
jgi:hypothetical protein